MNAHDSPRHSPGLDRGARGFSSAVCARIGLLCVLTAVMACSVPFLQPSPTERATQALSELLQAPARRYAGTLDKLGTAYVLDITVTKKGDMHASVSFANRSVEILRFGATVYQRGKSYWAGVQDPLTVKVFADNWIRMEASEDLSPAFVVADGQVEQELLDHFKPTAEADASVAGVPATKLSGHEGDLYVTRSQAARALRFVGASGFTTSGGLRHMKLDFDHPVPPNLQQPQQFIDPADHATWPAEFQVEKVAEGLCGAASCQVNAVVSNQGGASVGQAVATVVVTDDSGHNLGNCTANIPPIAHGQSETVTCAVSGPDWTSFTDRGGSYRETVTIHNPVYDD